jgi:hypothetical protein
VRVGRINLIIEFYLLKRPESKRPPQLICKTNFRTSILVKPNDLIRSDDPSKFKIMYKICNYFRRVGFLPTTICCGSPKFFKKTISIENFADVLTPNSSDEYRNQGKKLKTGTNSIMAMVIFSCASEIYTSFD